MSELTLRWVVTALFGVSIATFAYILVAHRERWTSNVNHVLHLTMSAAMILMAWRIGMELPTLGPMIFFFSAGAWFVRLARRVSCVTRDRLTNYYSAAMMAAMAWMYAVMSGAVPGRTGYSPGHAMPESVVPNMSGMQMPAQHISGAVAGAGWVTTVNWIAALGFAGVALYWPGRYFAERRRNPLPRATQLAALEPLYQAVTAAATGLMFGAVL